jgi:hypothetical protein
MNTLVPDDKSLVDIDTVTMRANIKDSKYNLSSDDQIKWKSHANFDTMKANNFNVMRAWWSVLDGKHGKWQKIYASNGILEVAAG